MAPRAFTLLLLALLRPALLVAAPSSTSPLPIQYFVDNIHGVYDGIVMDGGQPVRQVLTLTRSPKGVLAGKYVVLRDNGKYEGTFSNATVTGPLTVTFNWNDEHGQGIVTVKFTPKGDRFDGNWGEEQVRPDLTIDGQRRE